MVFSRQQREYIVSTIHKFIKESHDIDGCHGCPLYVHKIVGGHLQFFCSTYANNYVQDILLDDACVSVVRGHPNLFPTEIRRKAKYMKAVVL